MDFNEMPVMEGEKVVGAVFHANLQNLAKIKSDYGYKRLLRHCYRHLINYLAGEILAGIGSPRCLKPA